MVVVGGKRRRLDSAKYRNYAVFNHSNVSSAGSSCPFQILQSTKPSNEILRASLTSVYTDYALSSTLWLWAMAMGFNSLLICCSQYFRISYILFQSVLNAVHPVDVCQFTSTLKLKWSLRRGGIEPLGDLAKTIYRTICKSYSGRS